MQQTYLLLAISLGLSLITSTAGAHDGAPESFAIAVNQAWDISQKQQVTDQRLAAIRASQRSNRGWFAGTPELSGRYTSDRLTEDQGNDEFEVEVELPLWLSGQQAAIAATLDASYSLQDASVQADKLALAGIVRERYWDVVLKRSSLQLAQRRAGAAEKIAKDVRRHIDSGTLADVDELLARAEVLSARAEILSAQQDLYAAERIYLARTGLPLTGHWAVEDQGRPRTLESHPQLKKAFAEVEAARSEFQRINVENREHSRLRVGWSNERENRDEEYRDSLQIGFSIPFGKDRQNRSEMKMAAAEQLETEVRLRVLKRDLEANIVIALAALDTARLHEQSARLKGDASTRRLELDQATFDAGELGLQALLISRSNADEAEQNLQQRKIEVARAISMLNQALGYLPQKQPVEGSKL